MLFARQRELTEILDTGWSLSEEAELLYAFSRSVRIIGPDGSQFFTLREGEGVFIPPYMISNAIAAENDAEIHSVFFSPSVLCAQTDINYNVLFSAFSSFISIAPTTAARIEQAYASIMEEGYLYQLEASILISSVMLQIFREKSERMESRQDSRLEKMVRYIQMHKSENIHLCDIAKSAFVSERECLRLFSSSLGISPWQFLLSCRIRDAEELLRKGEGTVSDVAYRVGFNSLSHFSSLFRRKHGMTPSEFRERWMS